VRAARQRRHAELVARFNRATNNQYAGPDGAVAPDVIVAWQKANDVSVDGRIGPETVAAAKAAKPVPMAEAVQAPILEQEEALNDDEQ
jgi:lysozyme family protein